MQPRPFTGFRPVQQGVLLLNVALSVVPTTSLSKSGKGFSEGVCESPVSKASLLLEIWQGVDRVCVRVDDWRAQNPDVWLHHRAPVIAL